MKVGEIDTLKETFMADAFIQAKWREPRLDGRRHLVSDASSESYVGPEFLEGSWGSVEFNMEEPFCSGQRPHTGGTRNYRINNVTDVTRAMFYTNVYDYRYKWVSIPYEILVIVV